MAIDSCHQAELNNGLNWIGPLNMDICLKGKNVFCLPYLVR